MKIVRRGTQWSLLGLALLALLVPSCASKKKQDEAMEQPAEEESAGGMEGMGPDDAGEGALDQAEEEIRWKKAQEDVMYQRYYSSAEGYLKTQDLERALSEVNKALNYKPFSEEAAELRRQILRLRGDRAGEVGTVMDDQFERYKVKMAQQKVTVRKMLGRAQDQMEAEQFEAARRSFENARFIVTAARLSPLGTDDELESLGAEAEAGIRELDRIEAESRAEQERRDTEAALQRVAEQEERALLEARDRRERLLKAAIDHFNLEEFETAESFAQQVVNEEPDNTLARDIVENSRKARYAHMKERYLRELKESYRRWTIDIEETKVPSSRILRWPSQKFWDRITRLRAMRNAAGGGADLSPEEQNVLNTLKTRVLQDVPFQNTEFPRVVEFLTAASGVNFVIDARAKDDLSAVEITLQANNITVHDALELIMLQASAEGEIRWEVTGNVVRFIRREHQKKNMVLQIHPVADLTLPLTDFIPPQITKLGVGDSFDETPLFGGQAEEAPQPYGTIEELMELVRTSVSPVTWDEEGGQLNAQNKNLVIYAPPKVHNQVRQFLDDLRAFSGIVITIESRFLSVTDGFIRDVGVDFRGLGGTNGGPLAVLDDVTSGLDDNASAGIDNGGPGVNAGGAALAPSSGFFFNDGSDGDFRGRSENIFTNPLGQMLSALGGGTFQVTFLDDFSLSAIVRATEKSVQVRELTAPSLTVYNTQRANLTVVNQISFVQDFDVEVAQTSFIADPVIGVIQDGLTLDVRPTVSNDRQYITMELRPTIADLVTPIATFQTLLGASIAVFSAQNPVTIQLPEINLRVAESTVRIPDRGSILLGGLKDINIEDKKSTTPILGNLPILNFLFKRQGKSEEIDHLMIVVTATITDLQEEADRVLGQ